MRIWNVLPQLTNYAPGNLNHVVRTTDILKGHQSHPEKQPTRYAVNVEFKMARSYQQIRKVELKTYNLIRCARQTVEN